MYLWQESLNFQTACLKLYLLSVLLFCVIIVGTCLYETANSERSQEMRGDRDGEMSCSKGLLRFTVAAQNPLKRVHNSVASQERNKGMKSCFSFYLSFVMLVTNVYLSTIILKRLFFSPTTFLCLLSSDLSLMLVSLWCVHCML